jgi:hypothetical protein
MATYQTAIAVLPVDAIWSSSFGNPGEGGYQEYHRTPNGERWIVSNGSYDAPWLDWTCRKA